MIQSDSLSAKGSFSLKIFNKEGELLEDYKDENLVVGSGKSIVTGLIAGDTSIYINQIAVGTNGTDPAVGDSQITGAFIKDISSYNFPQSNAVMFTWEIAADEANNMSIREFGLLLSDNTLFARKTRSEILKTDAVRLVGTWKIIIV